MLYGLCNIESAGGSLNRKMIERLQKRLELVQIENRPLPLKRPDMPYTYLWVEITANLEWKYQVKKVKEVTLDKAAQYLASAFSLKQILQYIQSSIRPMIAYSLGLGIYTAYDIQILDSILARIAKKAIGSAHQHPYSHDVEGKEKCGCRSTSLMVDYLQVNAACMTNAFNDPGPLGKSIKPPWGLRRPAWVGCQHWKLGYKTKNIWSSSVISMWQTDSAYWDQQRVNYKRLNIPICWQQIPMLNTSWILPDTGRMIFLVKSISRSWRLAYSALINAYALRGRLSAS